MAEKYYSISPYVYVGNNPLRFIDPDGQDWKDVVAGYAIGFATNVIPFSSTIRDSYTPTSSSDYNRALQAVDNASLVLSGAMIVGGTGASSGGAATVTAGVTVSATGVGASGGIPAAIAGGAAVAAGEASIGAGLMLMANTADNKSQGYDRGKKDGSDKLKNKTESNTNYKKLSDKLLKDSGIDAHELKKDFLGKDAKISQYDLYKDNKTNEILILKKGGTGTPIQTGEIIK